MESDTIKKSVVVADCTPEEISSFVKELRYNGQGFAIESTIANWKRTGAISELKRYGTYFLVGLRYFFNRKNYRMVVGWQQFYTLVFCFFCSIFRVRKETVVVALNFTYKEKKGWVGKLYRWFMGKCISAQYLDALHVPSAQYADMISIDFAYPRERIIVAHFGINDCYDALNRLPAPRGYEKDGYALAIGRSNRDYDFLIRAWEDIEYPLVIISDTYKGDTDAKNITILRNVAEQASYPWIANCGLMVIPIADGTICSGDTVLLNSMALERKIVVTVPSTLAEMYIVDGENALLTEKKANQFKETVLKVLFSASYSTLGKRARKSFLENYSRQMLGKRTNHFINQQIVKKGIL